MQAVAHLIEQLLITQSPTITDRDSITNPQFTPVITPQSPSTPSTTRWSEILTPNPFCDSSDDVDEDEAYFLEEDDDDDDDDLDEYDEDDDDDFDDDSDELDTDENLDEEDF